MNNVRCNEPKYVALPVVQRSAHARAELTIQHATSEATAATPTPPYCHRVPTCYWSWRLRAIITCYIMGHLWLRVPWAHCGMLKKLAAATDAKLHRERNQFGERFDSHFLHDVVPVRFDCTLSGPQVVTNLLVQPSLNDKLEHFSLAPR